MNNKSVRSTHVSFALMESDSVGRDRFLPKVFIVDFYAAFQLSNYQIDSRDPNKMEMK